MLVLRRYLSCESVLSKSSVAIALRVDGCGVDLVVSQVSRNLERAGLNNAKVGGSRGASLYFVALRVGPYDVVFAVGLETSRLSSGGVARLGRLVGLVVLLNLEVTVLHSQSEVNVLNVGDTTASGVRNVVGSALEHVVAEVVQRTANTIRQNRRDVHVLGVYVAALQITLSPGSISFGRNWIAVRTLVLNTITAVAVTPQTLELQVILAIGVGYVVDGLSDGRLAGFLLVIGNYLSLSGLELVAVVALVVFLPLIEAASDLVLNVATNNLGARHSNIAVAVIHSRNRNNVTESTALIEPNTASDVAATASSSALLPHVNGQVHLI